MRLKPLLIGLFIYIVIPAVHVDSQIWLSNSDLYKEAEEFLNAEDYEEALPLYLLLEKKEFTSANIMYKIGTCYLNLRGRKEKALPYLKASSENVSADYNNSLNEDNAPLKALLLLGVAYRINNDPHKAIETFEMLKDSIDETNPELLTLIDLHIKRCENAIILSSFPGKAVKDKLPPQINDGYANYNPILVDDQRRLYYMEKLRFYDGVMEARNINGEWSIPRNITSEIGSDGDHYLVGASADGSKLFFYYYETLKAGEIYYTEYKNGKWGKLIPLNEDINTKYHETHASLSSNGKTLFFTSNKPGGFGGLDIYMSELMNDTIWGEAINLGPSINTPYNEESPFISNNDSILYFSSQGHMNMGGYDVFYSKRKNDTEWDQPINIGAPVSTTDDDLFYFPVSKGLSGLMSRLELPMNSSYDIYRYKIIQFPNPPRNRIKGNTGTDENKDYSNYAIYVIDTSTSDTVSVTNPDKEGNYELLLPDGSYNILVLNQEGEKSGTKVNLNNGPDETMVLSTPLLTQGEKTTSIEKPIGKDTLYLKEILFGFDTYGILPEYKIYLDTFASLLNRNPSLGVIVEGHTDALGADGYNLILSKKRAQAVVNYLYTKNVEARQVKALGKGEQEPVAINTNPDGSDNPEGRSYNRRSVIKPVSGTEEIFLIRSSVVPEYLLKKKE